MHNVVWGLLLRTLVVVTAGGEGAAVRRDAYQEAQVSSSCCYECGSLPYSFEVAFFLCILLVADL